MKRYVRSDTVPAKNSNATAIAKEVFGKWYTEDPCARIFKQSTGYAVKYYANTEEQAYRLLDRMEKAADEFGIPVVKSFTKAGFLGSVPFYVACIVVPAA